MTTQYYVLGFMFSPGHSGGQGSQERRGKETAGGPNLMTELEEALLALRVAENHFAEATEPDYIDLALDEIDVAHARLRLAIRRAKAERTA